MKAKNKVLCFLLFFLAIMIVCFVAFRTIYDKNFNVAYDFESTEEEIIRVPLEIDGLHSFVYLYNEDIIYQTIGETTTTFYRYNIQTDTVKRYEPIANYFMNGKSTAFVGNELFFYVTVLQKSGELENRLYSIDFDRDTLELVLTDSSSVHIFPMTAINNDLLSLRTNIENGKSAGTTDVVSFEPDTRQEQEVISNYIDYQNTSGKVMINISSSNDKLYVLTEIGESGNAYSVIEVFDAQYKLIETIPVTAIENYVNQPLSDFRVIGDYLFINTASNNAVIAKIIGNQLEVVLEETQIDLATCQSSEKSDRYIFFKRQTNMCYLLDETLGLSTTTLELDESGVIRCLLANKNGVLVVLNNVDKQGNLNSEVIYYIHYN